MTTTADEVWEILRELVEFQKQTEFQMRETGEQIRENAEQLRETREQFKETREQFREVRKLQQENSEQLKQVRKLQQETDEQMRKTDRKIKELGKQIGGLADKFGSFTEGLALPSMEKILTKQFKMEVISPRVRVRKGGEEMEIDVLAYSNGRINRAYVVEVKSHAKEEAIEQLKNILDRFRHFFPEHQNKQVYGILTAVDMSADVRNKALQEGLYVARIHNDIFKMNTPKNFQPQSW
jgi:chromosome segregation ATPase